MLLDSEQLCQTVMSLETLIPVSETLLHVGHLLLVVYKQSNKWDVFQLVPRGFV